MLLLSALALSARFSLMTGAMAPRMAGLPRPLRGLLAYCVTDETFALAVTRRQAGAGPDLSGRLLDRAVRDLGRRHAVGVPVGGSLPSALNGPLAAVFPVTFLVLAVLCVTSRTGAAVALLAAGLAIAGQADLPTGWHVVAAAVVASLLGAVFDRKAKQA